ncbi:MAG: hypothetical protein M3430_02255 [Acidobacteriota bacterium]|nr:hypothetical protein [Acidobacteriota bacterium]
MITSEFKLKQQKRLVICHFGTQYALNGRPSGVYPLIKIRTRDAGLKHLTPNGSALLEVLARPTRSSPTERT